VDLLSPPHLSPGGEIKPRRRRRRGADFDRRVAVVVLEVPHAGEKKSGQSATTVRGEWVLVDV
jgi:hypothetical protein